MQHDLQILLCLDEFERLEDLFPGDHQDLLRLMGVFRATIQHRKKLRLLVSGVAPFDELGQIWNDHFINVRELRVGHLDRSSSIDLLICPVPDFPEDVITEDVAASVYDRTGGQPYLLQLYGSLLITRLNSDGGRPATVQDLEHVEEEAMSQGAYYVRHTYEVAPSEPRSCSRRTGLWQKAYTLKTTMRWLARRGLIDDQGDLAIPVLGSFMREELELS